MSGKNFFDHVLKILARLFDPKKRRWGKSASLVWQLVSRAGIDPATAGIDPATAILAVPMIKFLLEKVLLVATALC